MAEEDDDDLLLHRDKLAEARQFKSEQANVLAKHIERVREAYKRVFKEGDADVQLVLDDLQTFARFNTTTFHENDRIHALLTGRYEVCRRIDDYTTLPLDTLITRTIKEG